MHSFADFFYRFQLQIMSLILCLWVLVAIILDVYFIDFASLFTSATSVVTLADIPSLKTVYD